MKMDTRSFGGFTGQGPLLIDQRKLFSPTLRPVTDVVALWIFAIVPVPFTKVQVPWAGAAGALAAKLVEVVGKQ